MILQPRFEPVELLILRLLNARMKLSDKDETYYNHLARGFEGEQNFDVWMENITIDKVILNGLLLEVNNSVLQIDTVLLTQGIIYLFEIKNYEGDYYIDNDRWFSISKTEIKNPLHQLKRNESLFRRLLQDLGVHFSIESYLIFINPHFNLYQAPLNQSIIFPTQLKRFLKKLNAASSKLTDKHLKLSELLVSKTLAESPYFRAPDYSYDQIEKGITCALCDAFIAECKKKSLVCKNCGFKEDLQSALLRSVDEFKILFPDSKITTNAIHEWCKVIESKKTIRRILSEKYQLMGYGRHSYYVDS